MLNDKFCNGFRLLNPTIEVSWSMPLSVDKIYEDLCCRATPCSAGRNCRLVRLKTYNCYRREGSIVRLIFTEKGTIFLDAAAKMKK